MVQIEVFSLGFRVIFAIIKGLLKAVYLKLMRSFAQSANFDSTKGTSLEHIQC